MMRAAARARCWLRPPRPGFSGRLHDGLAAPDAHLLRVHVQLVREAHSETLRSAIESLRVAPDVRPQRLRPPPRSRIDGDDRCDADDATRSTPIAGRRAGSDP